MRKVFLDCGAHEATSIKRFREIRNEYGEV